MRLRRRPRSWRKAALALPSVAGCCPACSRSASLRLNFGTVWCCAADCPDQWAASKLLADHEVRLRPFLVVTVQGGADPDAKGMLRCTSPLTRIHDVRAIHHHHAARLAVAPGDLAYVIDRRYVTVYRRPRAPLEEVETQ